MPLTIKQSDLYRFSRMVSKLTKPSNPPLIGFIPGGPDHVKLCAFAGNAVLVVTVPGKRTILPFAMSAASLKTIAVKGKADITLAVQKGTIQFQTGKAQGEVPQEKKLPVIPPAASKTATHGKKVLDALQTVCGYVDPNGSRLSYAGICLHGKTSQILGTTGKQLLVYDGFKFPWKTHVLFSPSKIFESKELKDIESDNVRIGKANDDWAYFSVGDVQIWLRIINTTFPTDQLPALTTPEEADIRLSLDQDNATFILKQIDHLPEDKVDDNPIFMVLGKSHCLRAYDTWRRRGISLPLTNSIRTGPETRLKVNRRFLKNALKMGFLHMHIGTGNERRQVICKDDKKTFVFLPFIQAEEPGFEGKMEIIAP
jgi:hypothetical protein